MYVPLDITPPPQKQGIYNKTLAGKYVFVKITICYFSGPGNCVRIW
jgi:hypothetical protein